RPRPIIVLCGRAETISWVSMYFEERNVPAALLRLEFFDGPMAAEFIDKRLDDKRRRDGARPGHRMQRPAFEEAREELFRLVYDLLRADAESPWGNSTVREFLGYAPVLVALADYLDNQNWVLLRNQIAAIRNRLPQFGDTAQ